MSEVTPERVAAIAAATHIPLPDGGAPRIAGALSPIVARYVAEKIAMPLETEPSSFLAVQLKDAGL